MPNYEQRRDKLRKLVRKEGAKAILVTDEINVTYLTGFTGDSSYLLLRSDGELLLTDSRYETQLAEECPDLDISIRPRTVKMHEAVIKAVKSSKLSNVAVEADTMSVAMHGTIAEGLPKVDLVSTAGLVLQLREIKDREEIDAIRFAVSLAERAFGVVRAALRPEQTEKEVADEIEHQIRLFGGECTSFPPIVGVGDRAALPHYRPGDLHIGDAGMVLIDWGAKGRLYMSDMTRTLVTGKMATRFERIYNTVLAAQRAGIKAIRPGAIMADVDAAARKVIEKAGFGRRFGHSLGHGIGLEIHEQPRLVETEDRPLKAGMVVTVEPGIYIPGFAGVRIEDDILVTRGGHEVLSSVPKEYADCVVA